jgi:uncharacterized protein YbjT (DUF2867 family)
MYTVLGATGNTGSIVAERLLVEGQKVRVVGRTAERLQALASHGAEPFAGDVIDSAFLTRALRGAKAVYVMIPPAMNNPDYRAYQESVSDAIARALEDSGIKHAVCLSSIGADKAEKTGPVVGLHRLEEKLNRISGLNVLHLRAAYFMENTLAQIQLIQTMGAAAGPLRSDLELPMIATRDIGAAAADALLQLSFHGNSTRELLGQRDISMAGVAAILGKALNKPDLAYVQAPEEQVRAALLGAGMSRNGAGLILEMAAALNSGHMRALEPRSERNTTPTSYETFAREEFVPRYESASQAA